MKQNLFFTLFLYLFLHTISLQAQDIRAGSTKIVYNGNESLQIELSGPMYFNEPLDNSILFSGLIPGEYMLKIYSSSRNGRNNMLINERIFVVSQQRLIVNIDRNGRLSSRSIPDNNTIYLSLNYNNKYSPYPGKKPSFDRPMPMDEREFNQLFATVKKAPFDKDKLDILSISSGYSLFYTEQIREMLKLFPFDDGKFDCIKILAPRAFDPQNLYSLGDVFSFISTKDKFYQYLKTNQTSRGY